MSDDELRAILDRVAKGELSPDEAAQEMEKLRAGRAVTVSEPELRRVRLTGIFQPTRVFGDAAVREAVATGPHRARREGDTLVIEGVSLDPSGFSFHWPGREGWGQSRAETLLRPVEVHMNPALALEVKMTAGLLSVKDVKGPIHAEIQAGSAKVEGFASPLDLDVTWGTVNASGVLTEGESVVHCEAGTVKVRLERGSSVRVIARSTLGRISLPGDQNSLHEGWTAGGTMGEAVVGAGSARLEVDTTAGAVWVEEG